MYGSKHRTTDGLYENRKDGSGYSSTKREWNLQTHGFNDDSSNHRKYIRTQSSSNNRSVPSSSSSSSQQQRQNGDKEKKPVKDTKKPLRVSGDWSEFKSSTGKTYFYNCKTEISQWEKPKGWLSEGPSSSSSTRPSSTTMSSNSTDRTKKESTSTNSNDSPTVRTRYKMEESSHHQRHSQTLPIVKLTSNNNHHHNGESHDNPFRTVSQESLAQPSTTIRLPSPGDDSSRMSFSSSSSSKESSLIAVSERNGPVGNESNGQILHSSLSESAIPVSNSVVDTPNKLVEVHPIPSNGTDSKASTIRSTTTTEPTPAMEIESPSPAISKAERDNEIQKFYRAELIQHLTDWPSTQLEKQCLKLFDEYYGYSAKMSTAFTELKALKSNFRVLEIKRSIQTQRLLRCQQHAKEREDDKLL